MNNILYKIQILSNLFLFSIIPILFVNFSWILSNLDIDKYDNLLSSNVFLRYISEDDIFYGNLFTILASIIYLIIAIKYAPNLSKKELIINKARQLYIKYGDLLYQLSILTLFIGNILAIIYGPIDDDFVSQRPKFALYLGYIKRTLDPAITSYLVLFILSVKKINYKFFLITLLYGLYFVLLGSRSFLLSIAFYLIVPICFVKDSLNINSLIINKTTVKFFLIGLFSAFTGNFVRLLRGGGNSINSAIDTLSLVMGRLFLNNSIIYVGQSRFEKLNEIILFNQPEGIFQNIFSFIVNRTHISSQWRVPELFGIEEIVTTSRGGGEHFVGFAYGWLGLSFGIFSWYGLIFIFVFFLLIFSLQKFLIYKLNIFYLIIYNSVIYIYFDFFSNLGLESIANKLTKRTFSSIIFIIVLLTLKKIVPQKVNKYF